MGRRLPARLFKSNAAPVGLTDLTSAERPRLRVARLPEGARSRRAGGGNKTRPFSRGLHRHRPRVFDGRIITSDEISCARHISAPLKQSGSVLFLFGGIFALRPDCLAGHTRLELRNVVAKYPVERSHGFPARQPNSGPGDYSRLSCGVQETQLGLMPGSPPIQSMIRLRPIQQHHCSPCAGLSA
jgi:hypothetical protein